MQQTPLTTRRIEAIDALRGFTLIGILIIHSYSYYFETTGIPSSLPGHHLIDRLLAEAVSHLFDGTLYVIFSFLFGISFAIQLQNASLKQKPFKGVFLWRLFILLLIGCLHRLFSPPDILRLYAVLGTILVLCVYLNRRQTLLLSGLLFLMSAAVRLYYTNMPEVVDPDKGLAAHYQFLVVFGLYKIDFLMRSGRLFLIPSLFILGLYAGQIKFFQDHYLNRKRYQKILLWAGSFYVLNALLYVALKFSGITLTNEAYEIVQIIEKTSLSFIFVSLLLLLYPKRVWHRLLSWLVPIGKMGLTIYISQSIFLVLFYQLPLSFLSKLSLVAITLITLLVILLQRSFARWWSSRHRYGPVEYVWRRLTYIRGTSTASAVNDLGSKNASRNLRPNARCLETEVERKA